MLCVLKNKKETKKWRKWKSIVIYIFLAHQYHCLQQKINVRVLHGSFSICNSILSCCFLYHTYTFSKKGPYKSLHFKSLVKMHLFLNYFSLYTDSLVKKIYILQDISLDLPVFFVWPWSASGRNRPFDGTVLLLFEHDLRCPDFAMERPLNRSQGWASPPTLVRSTRDVDMLKM